MTMVGAPEGAIDRADPAAAEDTGLLPRSDALTDLGLTLPIFVLYHLGVVLLPVRNAADMVTGELRALARHSLPMYAALTLGVGLAFVVVLVALGRGRAFEGKRLVFIAAEGTAYAVAMRLFGAWAVGSLRLGPEGGQGIFSSVVMSLGAGFYEEVLFRVGVFGLGAVLIKKTLGLGVRGLGLTVVWAVIAAMAFSGWHYMGSLADTFEPSSFVFRSICGLMLTTIFAFRGFAPAVWAHVIYDVWVMVIG